MTMKGQVRACPQIKEASKQTDVTSDRQAKALVPKLIRRAYMTTTGDVEAYPQIMEAC